MLPTSLLYLLSLTLLQHTNALKKCGIGAVSSKIVGGQSVTVDQFPWFIALIPAGEFARAQAGSNAALTVFCGASLITAKHALSAAHCFEAFRQQGGNWKKRLVAVFGLSNRCTPKWKDSSTFSNVVIHPQYNGITVKNDISLLYLSKDMSAIMPVCFPPAVAYSMRCLRDPQCGGLGPARHVGEVTITGYGTLRENSRTTPCSLQEATVIQYTRKQCMNTSVAVQIQYLPGVICAGVADGSRDSCQGDSGGPLMYATGGQYTLEGLVSFGNGCARVNNPGVYTNVGYYSRWVTSRLNNMRGPSSNKLDYNRWVKCLVNFNVKPCLINNNSPPESANEAEYNVITLDD